MRLKPRRRPVFIRNMTVVAGLAAAACAPAAMTGADSGARYSSQQAAPEEQARRPLTPSELETLLRGSRIVEADISVSYMRTPEEFHKNGSYVRHADNYEAHGKYSFRDGAVCVTADQDPEVCRKITIDQEGRYWITSRNNPRLLIRISVAPLQ